LGIDAAAYAAVEALRAEQAAGPLNAPPTRRQHNHRALACSVGRHATCIDQGKAQDPAKKNPCKKPEECVWDDWI